MKKLPFKKIDLKRLKDNHALKTSITSLLALVASLVVTGLIIAVSGFRPLEIYQKVFLESFSSKTNIALVISQATPLIFAGLSFAIGIKVGLINVGVEGQLLTGAMSAALVGAYVTFLPGKLHVITCVIVAALSGGLLSLFTTVLKVKTGASEIILGIMFNNIISLVTKYLVNGPLRPEGASLGQTKEILESAWLSRLVPRTQLTSAIIIAIAIAIILHIILNMTVLGYKMRVTGLNRTAGVVAGIKSSKIYLLTAMIYGAIAGVAGAGIALGVYHRFIDGLSVGYGFAGIPVAALAGYSPIMVPIAGILFGILKAGTMTLSRTTNVPLEIVEIIQALVVVFVSAPVIVTSLFKLRVFKKLSKKEHSCEERRAN